MTESNRQQLIDKYPEEEILSCILKAIKQNQIEFYLQPIVSLPQRKTRLFECYARIRLNESLCLRPQDYMKIAERADVLPKIDMSILNAIATLLKRIKRKQFSSGFFINIAEASLKNRYFMENLLAICEEDRDILNHMFFDISTHTYEMIARYHQSIFENIIDQGVVFCLDQPEDPSWDITELAKYGISYLKIPHNILNVGIQTLGVDKFLQAKAALDRNKIDLIATKIENEQDLHNIREIHVDYGQGYLFGVPMLYGTA